jgi:uncharacterized small protein (DUF1192 family)
MQNVADLNQAISALEREMQKALQNITQKEGMLKEMHSKGDLLKSEIKQHDAEIKQKEQEVLRLRQDIDMKNREFADNEKVSNRLNQEIGRLKLEHVQKNNTVGDLTRQQKDAAARQNIRH